MSKCETLEVPTQAVFRALVWNLVVELIIRLWVQSGINLHEWVFQKVSKFNEPAGRVKFELFEKNHECKLISNWTAKVVWLLINNIHKNEKNPGRSLTGSKGSCLFCWMFGNSLENLGKAPESAKTNIPTSFRNFRKSSEIFGENRNSRNWSAQDNLPAF